MVVIVAYLHHTSSISHHQDLELRIKRLNVNFEVVLKELVLPPVRLPDYVLYESENGKRRCLRVLLCIKYLQLGHPIFDTRHELLNELMGSINVSARIRVQVRKAVRLK